MNGWPPASEAILTEDEAPGCLADGAAPALGADTVDDATAAAGVCVSLAAAFVEAPAGEIGGAVESDVLPNVAGVR